jgi:lysophospholipase L1-like esterase
MPTKPSRWSRPALSVLSLVLFLFVVETILRVAGVDTFVQNRFFVLNRALDYPDVFHKDRKLFWRLRPDREVTSRFFEGRTFRINSLGLRGDEIDGQKSRKRIITVGNSCTFGWGLADRLIYPTQLEELLGEEYEVINAGIPGYTSHQGRKFLENELIDLRPDILLIMFAWNDHWAAASGIADRDQQFPPEIIIGMQNLVSRLHTYRLLKKMWLSSIEANPVSLFDRHRPVYRVGLEDFLANLTAICRMACAHGITPILLTSPIPSLALYYPEGVRAPMHHYHQRYNDITRLVAGNEQAGLVDLAEEFDNHDNLWDDAAKDPIHFNAAGHKLAAEMIAEFIRQM